MSRDPRTRSRPTPTVPPRRWSRSQPKRTATPRYRVASQASAPAGVREAKPHRTPEPERTCVGCRRQAPVSELVRMTVDADGALRLGPGPGRGAWLCRPPVGLACLEEAQRRRALDRALRRSVPDGEVQRFRAKLMV